MLLERSTPFQGLTDAHPMQPPAPTLQGEGNVVGMQQEVGDNCSDVSVQRVRTLRRPS